MAPPQTPQTYLCFDYGARRIGVAVGETLTRAARPLATLANGESPDWRALEQVVRDWLPAGLVVGLPLDDDGREQPITASARRFSEALRERFALPVHLADERYSSRAADAELRHARASGRMPKRVRKGDRDGQAARLILEQWLSEHAA